MNGRTPTTTAGVLCGLLLALVCGRLGAEVKITEVEGKLRVEIDGKHFTDFVYKGDPRPYLYPVYGPGGQPMTRNYPMKKGVKGEAPDHPHHRSIWHGHQKVQGKQDLWGEERRSGKIVHDKLLETKSGPDTGVIRVTNKWVDRKGKGLCSDETTLRFYGTADARMIDYEVNVIASEGKLLLGDAKDAFVAMRTHPGLRLRGVKKKKGTGHALNSTGRTDRRLWGKRAKWLDYWGPVEGKVVGIAMFDHPTNPRHPTYWHARDYGLVTANPFGIKSFTRGKKGPGDMTIEAGKSQLFRYRFYFHTGDAEQAKIAERYEEYTRQVK